LTLYWALTHLTSLPDPTKSVEDQDTKLLEILMYVEDEIIPKMEEEPD